MKIILCTHLGLLSYQSSSLKCISNFLKKRSIPCCTFHNQSKAVGRTYLDIKKWSLLTIDNNYGSQSHKEEDICPCKKLNKVLNEEYP